MDGIAGIGDRLDIRKPTVVVDERRVRRNIERMAVKARADGLILRPHFKTHQSAQAAELFREYSVSAICVSSVDMARYFADHGWTDITIATPVNLRQIEEINGLARRVDLGVVVESDQAAGSLADRVEADLGVWVEIDVGYLRTGVHWQDIETIESTARALQKSPHLRLRGILTHAGHSYHAHTVEEVLGIHRESVERMNGVKTSLVSRNFRDLMISVGDTPTCSIVERFHGVDEIRPGNFVFYDLTQQQAGSCLESDIAVAVACPVIARHPERGELVLYGGAVHLSKDFLEENGTRLFGRVALPTDDGWSASLPEVYVSKVSQEHGTVKAGRELIEKTRLGDILMVIPVHSCLVANLHRSFRTLEGRTWSGPEWVLG